MQKFSKPVMLCTLVVTALVSSGCPLLAPPDYLPSFVVNPDLLVFGKDVQTLSFTVSKSWTSQSVPQFTVVPNQPWISCDPTTGTSTGPADKVQINVTINRSLLSNGENRGSIVISAPGVAQTTVEVVADSILAANFVADKTNIPVGTTVQFTDLSVFTPESGPIIAWQWDFGDGGQSTQRHPRHTFNTAGLFTVELTVTTGSVSNTRRRVNYIFVTGQPPVAAFNATPRVVDSGQQVQFTDLSIPGSSPITSWLWNFGDGGTSLQANPAHIYNAAAIYTAYTLYTVSLTVGTAVGVDSHTEPDFIQVDHATTTANFAATPTLPVSGQPVQFQDMSDIPSGAPTPTYLWEFGDGATSTLENPTHVYGPGTYDVKLTVQAGSASSTSQKNDYITVNESQSLLHKYVDAPDQSYDFDVVNSSTSKNGGYSTYVVEMTSQTWRAADTAVPAGGVWTHWIVIVDPDTRASNTALLYITGGSNLHGQPGVEQEYIDAALAAQAPVAVIYRVPNQPIEFVGDPESEDRYEDEIISYTFDQYLDNVASPDASSWPLLFPMVKSVVRGMDTIDSVMAGRPVDGYVLSGASKRGWTTWLTAAYGDARIKGIAPIVIDILNMEPNMDHHYMAYDGYSEYIQDYWANPPTGFNIIQQLGTPAGNILQDMVDPYAYRSSLTLPKLIVNATGDQFFLPDSAQFYFNDLSGPSYLAYVPNAGHGAGDLEDPNGAAGAVVPFFTAISRNETLPNVTWDFAENASGTTVTVDPTGSPSDIVSGSVRLWTATRAPGPNGQRNFRLDVAGAIWSSSVLTANGDGTYSATVPNPAAGSWTAFYVDMQFEGDTGGNLRVATECRVTPSTMPFGPPAH